MSVEVAVFILRLLAGVSLIGFLALLFAIVWRGMRHTELQLAMARAARGYLTRQARGSNQPEGAGERYPLRAITTLGRSASNTVVVEDDFASGEHAQIVLEDGQWWLEDRRSRNGTRLNDAAIHQRAILADGDVIGIGEFSYRLSLGTERIS